MSPHTLFLLTSLSPPTFRIMLSPLDMIDDSHCRYNDTYGVSKMTKHRAFGKQLFLSLASSYFLRSSSNTLELIV